MYLTDTSIDHSDTFVNNKMEKNSSSKNDLKHIRMPDELITIIEKIAQTERRSFTDQVLVLLEEALNKRPSEAPPDWAKTILERLPKARTSKRETKKKSTLER